MNGAVDRILWRLDAYDRIWRACGQNGIAPIRFLTFRPEKLRIHIGESMLRAHIPIIFAPDLADKLGALLPASTPTPSGSVPAPDREHLRRWLSLAQLDGDLDALDVASYGCVDDFLNAMAALYVRFFDEARAAGSGEETAAFFQLVLASSLRNVLLHRVGANERFFGLAALLANLSDLALAATVDKVGDGLSARLGLLLISACSPLALMGSASTVAARLGNAYRTTPSAFSRARDMIRTQLDRATGFDLHAFRARLAAELLAEPNKKRDLVRMMLADAVRDLALLSTLTQGSELRELCGSSAALTEALFSPLGPEKLRARLARHPSASVEPLPRLRVLVDSIGAILAGDLEPLAKYGSIEERANVVAAGAIVLALDEVALEKGGEALNLVRPVPPSEAQKQRDDGRAYYFSLDANEPLFLMPKKREEAFLFADMKDFTKRTALVHEEAMGDFLKRHFYEPILKTCGHLRRNPRAHVSVVNLLGDAVAARGDIASMVALAVYVKRLLEEAADELNNASQAVLSGMDHEIGEIHLEMARVQAQIANTRDHNERAMLDAHLKELVDGHEQRLRKKVGGGLEAGVFISFGPEATVIDVGGEDVGNWRVVIAEHLNAAARGTSRSAALQEERDRRRAQDEKAIGGGRFLDPFRVHTSPDPNDTSTTKDFHNAGAALTGPALEAFKDVSRDLVFRALSIAREHFPPRLRKYWITRAVEELILCSDARGEPTLLFRKTGRTIFRGFESSGGFDIWEILLVDRGFGKELVEALSGVGTSTASTTAVLSATQRLGLPDLR